MSTAMREGYILTSPRGLFLCFLFAVFCRTSLAMMIIAHENMNRGLLSSKLYSSIEDKLQRLKFGYEFGDISANDVGVLQTQKMMLTRAQSSTEWQKREPLPNCQLSTSVIKQRRELLFYIFIFYNFIKLIKIE